MAEQVSSKSFKEKLTDHLTCCVCLDQYTNPKILPCHHSFCLTCIEPIPVELKNEKFYISCPTCRIDHLLPQGGPKNLPNAFQINSMLDLQRTLVATKQNQVNTSNPATQPTCPKHNDFLKVYCETCHQAICRDCAISTEHREHTFCPISECYPKHHQQILDSLQPVKHKLADMETAMTELATREREVLQQGESVKEEMKQHALQLFDDIQQSLTHLTQQVDTIVQQKTQTLATQRQQAQKIHTQLQTCQDTIEQNLKELTQQQILAHKYAMMKEMDAATEHVDPTVFQPIENLNIQFIKNKSKIEVGILTNETYNEATLEALPCLAKQPSAATLTLQSQDGSPFPLPPSLISSTLNSPGSNHSVKCPVTQIQPGILNIEYTSVTRQDQLMVHVGGVKTPNSPFTLPVIPTPEMRGEPVKIIADLDHPCGIAVCDNRDIVVAEQGAHCITVLNKEGEKLKSIGLEELSKRHRKTRIFSYPYGIAVSSDGFILVSDSHQLQKRTTNGALFEVVGDLESGSGPLQFNNPAGFAIHPTTGQLFIADSENNRIQVFNNDLTFSHTVTPQLGRFQRFTLNNPSDVALDNEGFMYIAERANHCITKLSDKGKYIKRFGSYGSAPGQLSHPSSLTIHRNLVYVCEWGNRVSVFDTDGKFVYCFGGHKTLRGPSGIEIDTLGNLYVSDTNDNRIVIF